MKSTWKLVLAAAWLAAFFSLAGCEGDDGPPGADGIDGIDGIDGTNGEPGAGVLPVDQAKAESCATCHNGVGSEHQAVYESYIGPSKLGLTITAATATDNGNGTYTVVANFSITKDGLDYVSVASNLGLDELRFYAVEYDASAKEYLRPGANPGDCRLRTFTPVAGQPGDYTASQNNCTFLAAPTPDSDWHVYGYIAQGSLLEHSGGAGAEISADSHVHIYEDVANAALAFGAAQAGADGAYDSAANVAGCEKCHGAPYLKHGFRAAKVAGLPDFAACKSCHFDNRNGGHPDWQYMVDEPLDWATGVTPVADYAYKAKIMNDVHMAHAMEFPYPQSMANCATCHEGKLDRVLGDDQFLVETCKSCHPVTGTDTWPASEILGLEDPQKYNQVNRAPALEFLWARAEVDSFHSTTLTCNGCHGNPQAGNPPPPSFSAYHTGYDKRISDAGGNRYADLYTASIDAVTVADDLMTIEYSVSDPAMVPEILVSFYGWDSKHFIVPSHQRDGSTNCIGRNGSPAGCDLEYAPGDANPLFTDFDEPEAGKFVVTLNMAAWVDGPPGAIPALIDDGTIHKAEITVTPELIIGGVEVGLDAATQTVDVADGAFVADYFKGPKATVDTKLCFNCHDQLAITFHEGSGRGGDIVACKNCHNPTFSGSHLEMASRSLENYVHTIHTFQAFDPGDVFKTFDPVKAKRYDQHIKHVFPNFTIRNCEACHVNAGAKVDPTCTSNCETFPVTYNVPDQSRSMPGLLSGTDTIATWYSLDADDLAVENKAGRNIGTYKPTVTGPASRACGACHRGRLINQDEAGALASFNAHTQMGGTYVLNENEDKTTNLFDIIDKIMSLFE